MKSRPTSISVIAWMLIGLGILFLISSIATMRNPAVLELMRKSPIPVPLQLTLVFLGLGITLVSGAFMLCGKAWARLLYVIWNTCSLATGVATSPMKQTLIPGFVFFAVIVFFLFRREANEFFLDTPETSDRRDV